MGEEGNSVTVQSHQFPHENQGTIWLFRPPSSPTCWQLPQWSQPQSRRTWRHPGLFLQFTSRGSDLSKITQLIQVSSLLARLCPQLHTHHGNGAAKVQNPVLQGEVEPEVKVEGSRACGLISLDRAVPGKNQRRGVSTSPLQPWIPPFPVACEPQKGLGTWGKEKKHMIKFWGKDCAGNTGVWVCDQVVGVLGVDSSCPDLSFAVIQEGSCQIGIITVRFSHL